MSDPRQTGQILIVEDDENTRALLEFLLQRAGFEVTLAVDGEQALDCIASMAPPRLVLLDVMMPYLDGFDVLARIRSLSAWQNVPVILLTARDRDEDVDKGIELGIAGFISKPFHTDTLVQYITELLGTRGNT